MLAKLELRALDVAAPNINGSAGGIHDRLMRSIVEAAMAPAEFNGESPRGLHVNMDRLTIRMAARSHADGLVAAAQEVIGAHDIIEGLNFQHDMLQPGGLARHAWGESDAVVARVAAQEAQSNVVVDIDPIAQAEA